MYALKIEVQGAAQTSELVRNGDDDDAGYSEVFCEVPADLECVTFSAGNPRVEHITGLVHLYRRQDATSGGGGGGAAGDSDGAGAGAGGGPGAAAASPRARSYSEAAAGAPAGAAGGDQQQQQQQLEQRQKQQQQSPGRSPTLCCLAIPADMPVASFCTFVGAYMRHVKQMRVLRREGPAQSVCMVLLTFDSQEQADGFMHDYNGHPFSSLEPEILCRLVYVRSVECLTGGGASADAGQAAGSGGGAAAPGKAAGDGAAEAAGGEGSGGGSGGGGGETERRAAGGWGPLSMAGHTELPTCPVCLERLDEHISGVVTTVCNHQFHGECLKAWGDTSCPVCRYCSWGGGGATSRCAACGTGANLWICLICGHVGCGRYKSGHASEHWKESSHCYALELETQRVWDYAGDGYVHRLIQSKTDGKLVEVPSPAPACGRHHARRPAAPDACAPAAGGGGGRGRGYGAAPAGYGGAGGGGGGGDGCEACAHERDLEDAMVASKIDAISFEYNHLLTSQLDSQRQYFEGLLERQRLDLEARAAAAAAQAERAAADGAAAGAGAKEAERRRAALERKLAESQAAAAKLSEEKEFLRSLNEQLLANQKVYAGKLKAAEEAAAAKDATITDLQEQVRDLMVYIEAGRHIEQEGGGLAEATLLPLPQQAGGSGGGGKDKRRTSGRR